MPKKTKVDASMEDIETRFSDDPERVAVVQVARRFKASWIELAEALARVKRGNQWKRWGYDSFDAYAKTELRLRQETVDKLTGAYMFLQKRSPETLASATFAANRNVGNAGRTSRAAATSDDEGLSDGESYNASAEGDSYQGEPSEEHEERGDRMELPSYQTLDFLRRAEEHAPKAVVSEMFAKVMEEGVSLPKLRKEYGAVVFPVSPEEAREKDRTAIRNVASRLAAILEQSEAVPLRLSLSLRESLLELIELVTDKKKSETNTEAAE
jgi:hypothetical protein